jgi:hypothetical protein
MSTAFEDGSARSGMVAPVPFTLIDIGTRQTRVVTSFGSAPHATMDLALGSAATAERFFKLDPLPRTNSKTRSTRSRTK